MGRSPVGWNRNFWHPRAFGRFPSMDEAAKVDSVMLAHCPQCKEHFLIAGAGRIACPFCQTWFEATIHHDGTEPSPNLSQNDKLEQTIENQMLQALEEEAAKHIAKVHRLPAPWDQASEARSQQKDHATLPPWERTRLGLLARFFRTLQEVITQPRVFFRMMGGYRMAPPLLFAALLFLIPAWVETATFYFSSKQLAHRSQHSVHRQETKTESVDSSVAASAAVRTPDLFPFGFVPTALFVWVLTLVAFGGLIIVYQLAISLAAWRWVSLRTTIRGISFGFAPTIFSALPVIGLWIAVPWTIWVLGVSFCYTHNLGAIRAALATALPIATTLAWASF